MNEESPHLASLPCCPPFEQDDTCDRNDLRYTLTHKAQVVVQDRRHVVPVQVTPHFRIERCPGPLAIGDLVYTMTLLPGEKIRLVTTDRRSRFSYDSETKVSYRHAQTSEESYYMVGFMREMSDLNVSEWGESNSHAWGQWQGSADSSYGTVIFAGGGEASIQGSYDDASTSDFMSSLSKHAESSHYR